MPTAKRHTRRIKQMARYLDAVLYSAMYEGDYDHFTEDEERCLRSLYITLNAYAEAKHYHDGIDTITPEMWGKIL